MPELDKATLLGLWLEGKLDEPQRQAFEQLCVQDKAFAAKVEAANLMAVQGETYQVRAVPEWDRESTFALPEKRHWWQWQGLSAMSFATSMLAIVMVVTGLNVEMKEGAITLSFTKGQSEQQVTQLIQSRMDVFHQEQQLALLRYAENMQQQQLAANTELTNYLLSSSRQERREDFAELIKFINQQRSDNQLFFARQMNNLQQEIYQNPDYLMMPPQAGSDTSSQ